MSTGITVEQALLVREQHQQICLDQIGHHCRQGIVITKPQLITGHGVILIHDRHNAELQNGTQCAAGIEIALAIGQDHHG